MYSWGRDSDISQYIYPPDAKTETFEDFCADWKEHYFLDESPELGRVFFVMFEGTRVGVVAYNDIDLKNRVELDIWMNSEANCGKGFGTDAITALCGHLTSEFGVHTFMMQPSASNPRAIRAYEKAGFVRTPATPEEIQAEWGGVDGDDAVLMIRRTDHTTTASRSIFA